MNPVPLFYVKTVNKHLIEQSEFTAGEYENGWIIFEQVEWIECKWNEFEWARKNERNIDKNKSGMMING